MLNVQLDADSHSTSSVHRLKLSSYDPGMTEATEVAREIDGNRYAELVPKLRALGTDVSTPLVLTKIKNEPVVVDM